MNMSSSLPDIPSILYCGIGESTKESRDQLLRSETLEAALTRLITTTGIIHTVAYGEHIANRQYYVIKLECAWPKGKAKAILDPKCGSGSLRNEGYDVAIRTRENGGYSFVIINPHEVVYRVIYQSSTASPVVIATRYATATIQYRRRTQGDPREPQEELDSLVLKLNRPSNPLDDFCIQKIAASNDKELAWAKDQVVGILKRVTRDSGNCWRYVLTKGQCPSELQLRVLFMSFGRKRPDLGWGVRAVHQATEDSKRKRDSVVEICVRPSHLYLIGTLDSSLLKRTVEDLSTLLGQMDMRQTKK